MTTSTPSTELRRPAALPGTVLLAVLVVLAVAGVAAWILQLTQGMGATGLSQQVAWGIYIALFFTAAGAGAAALALAAVGEFGVALPVDRARLLLLALGGFIVAALAILFDLGNPLQLWRIATAGRFNVMLTWDFWLLAASGVIALVYLFAGRRPGAGRMQGVGALALVAAAALVVVEGWMVAIQPARPLWTGGTTVVSFLLGAAIAGVALALLVRPAARLRGWLGVVLGLSLVLVLAEVVTALIGSDLRAMTEMRNAVTGTGALLFWLFLLFGLALPLGLLVAGKGAGLVRAAAALAALGVLVEKLWLLVAGQAVPWMPAATVGYLPAWVELVSVLGLLAIGGLFYVIALKVLRVPAQD